MKKLLCIAFAFIFILISGCSAQKPTDLGKPESKEESTNISVSQIPSESKDESEEKEESEMSGDSSGRKVINHSNIKGVWLTQFDLYDVLADNYAQRDEKEYRTLVKKILQNIASDGWNTVFLQVRPNGDSFCPSEFYTPSFYVTGKYGREFKYDPVPFFLDCAHDLNLSVHAWINPYRLMTVRQILSVPNDNFIKKMYAADRLKNLNDKLYFDPADSDAEDFIAAGASELLQNYEFDGLHIDDYFYPTTDPSFDRESFAKYKENHGGSLDEFRVGNINRLVQRLYRLTKENDEKLLFGVSPAGNLKTLKSKHYADPEEWCRGGYPDYLVPQIYFGFEHQSCPFVRTCEEWKGITRGTKTSLVIGLPGHKAINGRKGEPDRYAGIGSDEWIENTDIIGRMIMHTDGDESLSGYAFFSYKCLYDPVTGAQNALMSAERKCFADLVKAKRT